MKDSVQAKFIKDFVTYLATKGMKPYQLTKLNVISISGLYSMIRRETCSNNTFKKICMAFPDVAKWESAQALAKYLASYNVRGRAYSVEEKAAKRGVPDKPPSSVKSDPPQPENVRVTEQPRPSFNIVKELVHAARDKEFAQRVCVLLKACEDAGVDNSMLLEVLHG